VRMRAGLTDRNVRTVPQLVPSQGVDS
jgi:hypothetical protein